MRPFKECHRRKQGQLSHPGETDERRYFRANGHEYGRWPEEGHDAVTGTSSGADAECFRGLNTQHDPGRASRLAWRVGGDDDGLLGALPTGGGFHLWGSTGRPPRLSSVCLCL